MSDAVVPSPTRPESAPPEPPGEPGHVLVERLVGDLQRRWRSGERVPVEAYLRQQPLPAAAAGCALRLIYAEMELRLERGEPFALEEYIQRFPHYRPQLQGLAALGAEQGSSPSEGTVRSGQTVGPAQPATREPVAASRPLIPGYELLAELGRGGMGVVYKARQTTLKRLVAVKVLRDACFADADDLRRFRLEVETLAALRHPNIVQVYEVGEVEGRPYCTLELVEGGSLAQLLAREPQPPTEAARLLETLARVVHAAHQQGIVHRDLKPANILLVSGGRKPPDAPESSGGLRPPLATESSGGLRPPLATESSGGLRPPLAEWLPKITDFGLAKHLDDPGGHTRTGDVLGTPSYMAPEQALGRVHAIGPATDVYALGAILYEMLTGRPPFKGVTALDTLAQVKIDEPVPVRQLQPRVPRDLETICLKCLHKDPLRRYASALALADDLRCFQAGEPIHARAVGRLERLGRWCRRNPVVAGLTAGLVLAITLGFAATFGKMREAQEQQRLARQHARDATAQRNEAQKQRRKAQREAALAHLDEGQLLCAQGEVAHGLLLLAEGLDEATQAQASDLEHAFRFSLAAWYPWLVPSASTPFPRGGVTAVAFSPDGTRIALAKPSRPQGNPEGLADVEVREVASGKRLHRLPHLAAVHCAAFQPDGNMLLTGDAAGQVRLWDLSRGALSGQPLLHPDAVWCVAFSPNGRRALTGCQDGKARLWDVARGRLLGQPLGHPQSVRAVAFSPDGERILTGCADGLAQLWQWHPPAAPVLLRQWHHSAAIVAVAFRPDGQAVLTGSLDHLARLWSLPSGPKVPGLPLQHHHQLRTAVFSRDGRTILTGAGWRGGQAGDQGEVQLWDAATHQPLGPSLDTPGKVKAATLSLDGSKLLAASALGLITFDVSGIRSPAQTLHNPGQLGVSSAAFSPNGKTLLTASNFGSPERTRELRVWDVATGAPLGPPLICGEKRPLLACSPDSRTVLVGDGPTGASLHDVATGKPVGRPLRPGVRILAADFSPDGKALLTSGVDRTTCLWNAATGQRVGQPRRNEHRVLWLTFSPDGKTFLAVAPRGTLGLFETATGRALGRPMLRSRGLVYPGFSADGKYILAGEVEGRVVVRGPAGADQLLSRSEPTAEKGAGVRIWQAGTGKLITALPAAALPGPGFPDLTSPTGQMVLRAPGKVGDGRARLQFWDLASRRRLPLIVPPSVGSVAFHPEGRLLATGEFRVARFRDAATGRTLGPPLCHRSRVLVVRFSPDGQRLATCCDDGMIRIWQVPKRVSGEAPEVRRRLQRLTGKLLDEADMLRPRASPRRD